MNQYWVVADATTRGWWSSSRCYCLSDSPLKPKGKQSYEIAEDRKEDDRAEGEKHKEESSQKLVKTTQPGVDTQARWVKKAAKLHYGYKRHDAVDVNGLVLGTHTTTANEHDSKGLEPLLKKVPKRHKKKGVFTDKGYKVPDNDQLLKKEQIKNRIQYKAYRNRPLTEAQKRFNKLISQSRWVVERTFGSIKRWFNPDYAKWLKQARNQ